MPGRPREDSPAAEAGSAEASPEELLMRWVTERRTPSDEPVSVADEPPTAYGADPIADPIVDEPEPEPVEAPAAAAPAVEVPQSVEQPASDAPQYLKDEWFEAHPDDAYEPVIAETPDLPTAPPSSARSRASAPLLGPPASPEELLSRWISGTTGESFGARVPTVPTSVDPLSVASAAVDEPDDEDESQPGKRRRTRRKDRRSDASTPIGGPAAEASDEVAQPGHTNYWSDLDKAHDAEPVEATNYYSELHDGDLAEPAGAPLPEAVEQPHAEAPTAAENFDVPAPAATSARGNFDPLATLAQSIDTTEEPAADEAKPKRRGLFGRRGKRDDHAAAAGPEAAAEEGQSAYDAVTGDEPPRVTTWADEFAALTSQPPAEAAPESVEGHDAAAFLAAPADLEEWAEPEPWTEPFGADATPAEYAEVATEVPDTSEADAAAEAAEAEQAAAEQEAQRQAAAQAERVATEEEAARVEAEERLVAEQEAARVAAEQEAARVEAERLVAEQEAARVAA
ncbi:MAG: hypothetical protein JWR35_1597 [Marmoricola sp.]|nr:hypothetical protein [Marmoricola sp.]